MMFDDQPDECDGCACCTLSARLQPAPQPPPTYTSHGSVPDGYVTWASRLRDISDASVRERGFCYPYLRDRAGVIRLGRLFDRKAVRRCVDAARCN